jgi:hypothetical protein
MRNAVVLAAILCLTVLFVGESIAREQKEKPLRAFRSWTQEEFAGQDVPIREYLEAPAQVDTYVIVHYDFEVSDWQGWTRGDITAEIDTFWHVEDFLEPEFSGFPGPLEGEKSAWCGAPPGPEMYLCIWTHAPGYGNQWNQSLTSDEIEFTGRLVFSYKGRFNSEEDYDCTTIEYMGINDWEEVHAYDGVRDTVAVHELYITRASTKLRFHFTSDGAWSDVDGWWDSDGAACIDSITVADESGVIDYEDFESADDNAKHSGIWNADVRESFGMYSGLRYNLQSKDPCGFNYGTQIVFFVGSTEESTEYQGLYNTPRCRGAGGLEAPCQNEWVISPVIDLTRYTTNGDEVQDAEIQPGVLPGLGGVQYNFTVYRDLPQVNLVFYNWGVRDIVNGCPMNWEKRHFVLHGQDQRYIFSVNEIGDLVGSDSVQVYLKCMDMCAQWYSIYGDCAEHTPSPWFDNVQILRYEISGPQFSHRRFDLFQDNFPGEEFDLESYVRADMAADQRWDDDPVFDPGDSIVVGCDSPLGGGLRYSFLGPDSLPEIYMNVKCTYIGCGSPSKPDIAGPSLEGTYGRYESDDGVWTVIRGAEARQGDNTVHDRFMFDLNDSLLTRGYMVEYYFTANDNAGHSGSLPEHASEGIYFEFTCLPTLCSQILYVDDFDGRGSHEGIVQNYFDPVFLHIVPIDDQPDRYDVNQPSSLVGNGLGSRAKLNHMTMGYNTVIWDSGDLSNGTITDGTAVRGKSNDCQLLIDWINYSEQDVNLWVLGDDVANDLSESFTPQALDLMSVKCGVTLVDDSYYGVTGVVTPKVMGMPGCPFYHESLSPPGDTFCIYGGCPTINRFDCLGATGNGSPALEYGACQCGDTWAGSGYYGGVWSTGVNEGGYNIRTVWFGFSFMNIRDCELVQPLMRDHLFKDVYDFFEQPFNPDWPVGDGDDIPSHVYKLSQNYPNPFNPQTTIRFSLREKGPVTIRIYDVAGRLVKTLVDEVRDAGAYAEPWDGRNNRDGTVASGVYFYRMESKSFSRTRKMVLLR